MDYLNLLDFGGPYFLLAQAIGRWGNFTNNESFGTNTNLPWGMTSEIIQKRLEMSNIPGIDPNLPVHPTFYMNLYGILQLFSFLCGIERDIK